LFSDKLTPGAADPTGVDELLFGPAAEAASREVDGYLRRRYQTIPLPLPTISTDLKQRVIIITLYKGYQRRGGAMPEERRNAYTDTVKWLERMAKGEVDPGIAVPPAANTQRNPSYNANERQMTRAKMKGL